MGGIGYFQAVSNLTQFILNEVLSDEKWLEEYIEQNQKRIQASYVALKEALAVINVTLYESQGTLMAWADFRSHLPSNPTWKDEEELCKRLFKECGFLITPGQTCISTEPGYFRIVFTESGEGSFQELKERFKKYKK